MAEAVFAVCRIICVSRTRNTAEFVVIRIPDVGVFNPQNKRRSGGFSVHQADNFRDVRFCPRRSNARSRLSKRKVAGNGFGVYGKTCRDSINNTSNAGVVACPEQGEPDCISNCIHAVFPPSFRRSETNAG